MAYFFLDVVKDLEHDENQVTKLFLKIQELDITVKVQQRFEVESAVRKKHVAKLKKIVKRLGLEDTKDQKK